MSRTRDSVPLSAVVSRRGPREVDAQKDCYCSSHSAKQALPRGFPGVACRETVAEAGSQDKAFLGPGF